MVSHFFPGLTPSLKALPDRRDPDLTGYSAATLCWTLILMYATRLGSRRQIGRHLNEPEVWGRLSLLAAEAVTATPHGDTAAGYLDTVPVERTQEVEVELVRTLLEGRRLEAFRLLDTYYTFAFDLSGQLVLGDTPSALTAGCLTQQMKDGRTIYYRPVEEAKLVTPAGLALSSDFCEVRWGASLLRILSTGLIPIPRTVNCPPPHGSSRRSKRASPACRCAPFSTAATPTTPDLPCVRPTTGGTS